MHITLQPIFILIYIQIVSSTDKEDQESIPITEKIKEQLAKPIEKVKTLGDKVVTNVKSKVCYENFLVMSIFIIIYIQISSSTDEEDEESISITDKIKEQLAKPIEKMKTLGDKVVTNVKSKVCYEHFLAMSIFIIIYIQISSSKDETEDEESIPITEQIKERLTKPIETAKDIGDQILTNVKQKVC